MFLLVSIPISLIKQPILKLRWTENFFGGWDFLWGNFFFDGEFFLVGWETCFFLRGIFLEGEEFFFFCREEKREIY